MDSQKKRTVPAKNGTMRYLQAGSAGAMAAALIFLLYAMPMPATKDFPAISGSGISTPDMAQEQYGLTEQWSRGTVQAGAAQTPSAGSVHGTLTETAAGTRLSTLSITSDAMATAGPDAMDIVEPFHGADGTLMLPDASAVRKAALTASARDGYEAKAAPLKAESGLQAGTGHADTETAADEDASDAPEAQGGVGTYIRTGAGIDLYATVMAMNGHPTGISAMDGYVFSGTAYTGHIDGKTSDGYDYQYDGDYRPEGTHITRSGGVFYGPSGKETYYNLPMQGVVRIMRRMGFSEEEYPYWVREDGAKMLGPYVMVAAHLGLRPRGSTIPTSMGTGLVCDTGDFAASNPTQLDLAMDW